VTPSRPATEPKVGSSNLSGRARRAPHDGALSLSLCAGSVKCPDRVPQAPGVRRGDREQLELRRETSISQAVVIARHFFRSDGESTSATGAS
jgi:hypothetical protein